MYTKIILFVIVVGITEVITGRIGNIKRQDNPYVTLYANEYHRGTQHVEFIKEGCKNLPENRKKWASSVNTHHRCVDLCDLEDCKGRCVRVYPSTATNLSTGLKLSMAEFNDQAISLKSCYTLLRH